jgi:predicted acyl esterase
VTYEVSVRRGVRIDPGLGADLLLPAGAGPVPAVVALMPYRVDSLGGAGCWSTLRRFAAAGYGCVLVDCRGLGSSDGPPRAPFDPAEADDGVAAVEWAAAQPWCDGAVGMWGFSWGAALALRTATRRPAPLRAVVSLMGMLDPERDFVHPAGVRGMVGPLAVWGVGTLVNQLLPPLAGFHDPDEQRRWRERVERSEPYLVDVGQHPPGHPVWRSRAIDASAVIAPTLSVGGWRDMFCDAAVGIYERVRGPRALVMGPWMHSAPDDARDEPVDATALALRWWTCWLGDTAPTAATDPLPTAEPAVTVYVQGAEPGWRTLAEWPPSGSAEAFAGPVASARRDPTVGTLSGLWGIPNGGFGRPLDQRADDARGVTLTGPPLADPLLLAGRPEVTVTCPDEPGRLVVKLADIDPDGRSTLITGGILTGSQHSLDPTCYRVAAGHRLRVVVGDSAFPRIWPAPDGPERLELRRLEVRLPVVSTVGRPMTVERPSPRPDDPPWVTDTPRWEITREPISDRVTVVVADELTADLPDSGVALRQDSWLRAAADQSSADLRATSTVTARLPSGELLVVRVELFLDGRDDALAGTVRVDDVPVAERRWRLPPEPGRGNEGGEQQQSGAGEVDRPVPGDQRPVTAR